MSAIAENPDEPVEVIQVLFALHPNFGAQELCGPLEVLSNALQKINVPGNYITSRPCCFELHTFPGHLVGPSRDGF